MEDWSFNYTCADLDMKKLIHAMNNGKHEQAALLCNNIIQNVSNVRSSLPNKQTCTYDKCRRTESEQSSLNRMFGLLGDRFLRTR